MTVDSDSVLRVRAALRAAAPTAGSFEELVAIASGMFPTSVLELAKGIAAEGPRSNFDHILHPAVDSSWKPSSTRLPTPHPLDFEWRFAPASCRTMPALVDSMTVGSNKNLALFGTPALAERLCEDKVDADREVTLFERRAEACDPLRSIDSLRVVMGDVGETTADFGARFDMLIADPPWYADVMITFIEAASTVLRPGGVALFCLPALATRPGVAVERAHLLTAANSVGLELEQLIAGAVTYESPLFERAALRASGLPNFDPLWRRGDVILLRNLGRANSDRLDPRQAEQDGSAGWEEVVCGPHRVRVHTTSARRSSHALDSVVEGDVLTSVSVRDPRRPLANVWTTTNRIYSTDRPDRLVAALRSHASREGGQAHDQPAESASKYLRAARRILVAEAEDLDYRGV